MESINLETLKNLAILSGFTEEDLEKDPRILKLATSISTINTQFKFRNNVSKSLDEVESYYTFLNNLQEIIKESENHVKKYDTIRCNSTNNIVILYTEYFNSISLNWGPSAGMNIQLEDEHLIELRNKLLISFPL